MAVHVETLETLSQLYRKGVVATTLTSPYAPSASFNNRISVIVHDITTLACHAIVNAANRSLLGGGGVDGAIHRAAGPELVHECAKLGGCDTGDAKITESYDLPARGVIHTVGPIWKKHKADEAEADLRSCYKRSLQVLRERKGKTIAFPAIATGVYGYPVDQAARVALTAVREFLVQEEEKKTPAEEQIARIVFCNFSEPDQEAYLKILPEIFPPTTEDKAAAEQAA